MTGTFATALSAFFRPSPPRGMIRSTTPSWPASSASCSRPPVSERDRALGELGGDDRGQHGVRVRRRGRAAQHDRVAGLQAQRGGVDGHVRPRLVDDGDDAERHAHLAHVEPVGQPVAVDDLADGVGQRGDRAHRVGDRRRSASGRARAGPSARRRARPRGPPRGRGRWPRGSRRARSSSASATRSSAASLAAVLIVGEHARGGAGGEADVGDGGSRDGHARKV